MTAVDHAELKPCPFCGSAAKLETYGDRLGISCTECFCRTPLCQPGEDPLPIWNLRTQAPDSWRPMSEAPTDRIIIAMCRYPTATAGSPSFVGWDGTEGWVYSRNKPERVVCWAWKPRELLGDWPQEADLRPQTAESGK